MWRATFGLRCRTRKTHFRCRPSAIVGLTNAWLFGIYRLEEANLRALQIVTRGLIFRWRAGCARQHEPNPGALDAPFFKLICRFNLRFQIVQPVAARHQDEIGGFGHAQTALLRMRRAIDAIEVDPWTAVYRPIPDNAAAELLTSARQAAVFCLEHAEQGPVFGPEITQQGNDGQSVDHLAAAAARVTELDSQLSAMATQPAQAEDRQAQSDVTRMYRGIGNNVWPSEHGEAVFFSTDPSRAAAFGQLHYVDVTADEMAKFEHPHSTRILQQEPIAENDWRTARPRWVAAPEGQGRRTRHHVRAGNRV